MSLRYRDTHKGLRVANFTDRYGESCSIQRSSINGEDCIWLGRDDPPSNGNGQPLARMHLDRRLVRELLPALIQFVNEGTLPGEPENARRDSVEALNRWPPFEWPPAEVANDR